MQRPERIPLARTAIARPADEHLVEQRLLRYLKTVPHLTQFKMGTDGWPDRIICYRGVFLAIEIKSERTDHHPTRRQVARLEQLKAADALAGVVRTVEELRSYLSQIDDWHTRTGGLPWQRQP